MLMPDLSTKEGQAAHEKSLADATEKLLAELRADKKKHGGLSVTQRTRPVPDRFANANINGGGL